MPWSRSMLEVLHVSDTHLGYQAYGRLTADGLNQREVDFQEAFRRVVDEAIAHPPDVVVHSGDLFDVVRPTNRAIGFALDQVRRLSAAKIPLVLVSGNHEAPRLRETGSIFRIFDGLPGIHAVYRGEYEAVRVETRAGPATVHAIPQTLDQSEFTRELARAAPHGNGLQLMTTHGTVSGVDGLFMHELNELTIPENALRPDYDYIALGHFHNHRHVGTNAAYAGSTERTSFAEALEDKVALRVGLGGGRPRIHAWPTAARPMRDGGHLDAAGWTPDRIAHEVAQRLDALSAPGAIVRLIVDGVDASHLRALDTEGLRRSAPDAFHVDLRFHPALDPHATQHVPELGSLEAEFEAFLATRPLPGVDRAVLSAHAHGYLRGDARAG